MENDKTIIVLNKLVEINNDRIEGYKTASEEAEEQDLKALFIQFGLTSQKCNRELEDEISGLGGTPTRETKTSGKFFRTWMDVKNTLTGHDRVALLNSCEYGEDHAIETYEKVLTNDLEYLNVEQQTMISSQLALIRADHYRLKSIRDAMVV